MVDPRYRQIADDLFGAERDAYAAEMSGPGRKPEQSEPTVEVKKAAGPIAAELELAEGSFVVTRRQRRFIDGAPYSLQTTVDGDGLRIRPERVRPERGKSSGSHKPTLGIDAGLGRHHA